MEDKKITTVSCPTCKKRQSWDSKNSYRPFCSERCKLIDLGAWADELHRIPGEKINPEPGEDTGEDAI